MKNIKTFEEYNKVDEGLWDNIKSSVSGNYTSQIKEYLDDINSGKNTKLENLKKDIIKYKNGKPGSGPGSNKFDWDNAIKDLETYLNNPSSNKPQNLEELIAKVLLKDKIVKKDKDGVWTQGSAWSAGAGHSFGSGNK